MLPVLFFVSALAAGHRHDGRRVVLLAAGRSASRSRPHLLARLSRASVVVLALYLALRLRDLWVRDALSRRSRRSTRRRGCSSPRSASAPCCRWCCSRRARFRRVAAPAGVGAGPGGARLRLPPPQRLRHRGRGRHRPAVRALGVRSSWCRWAWWPSECGCSCWPAASCPVFPEGAVAEEPATAADRSREPSPVPAADVDAAGSCHRPRTSGKLGPGIRPSPVVPGRVGR